jgi:hypothetical protein
VIEEINEEIEKFQKFNELEAQPIRTYGRQQRQS